MSVAFYDDNARVFIEQTRDVDMESLYERFCSLLPDHGSVLDVGSGSGRDALAFKQMGYEVVAFDASIEMVEATRRYANVETHHARFEDFTSEQRFDGIWACASLLHVRRGSLGFVLERFGSLLKKGGAFYLSFKMGEQEREKDGRYFNDMDERLLTALVADVPSVEVHEIWITEDRRPERSSERWLNAMLTKAVHNESSQPHD